MLVLMLPLFAAQVLASPAPPVASTTVVVPFDFSRSAIGVDVTIKGTPLYMILDTGVDPSLIDLARAGTLGLEVDRKESGEASGFGDGKGAVIFPSSIVQLAIDGHAFDRFDALATNMDGMSAGYGRKLDGVLGYSFLSDKIVLIDYPLHKLAILTRAEESAAMTNQCRQHWTTPLLTVDNFPIIPDFRFGNARAPVSLDTGSNGTMALFQSALKLPGAQAALSETGTIKSMGARGGSKAKSYTFNAPVGFGPFTLPPGQVVSLYRDQGGTDTRVANVGNKLLSALKLKLLLNYRAKTMTFFGDCP